MKKRPTVASASLFTSPEALVLKDQLCILAWEGKLEEVRNLLTNVEVRGCINIPNPRGQTALYCAARQGFAEILVEILNVDGINLGTSFSLLGVHKRVDVKLGPLKLFGSHCVLPLLSVVDPGI